MTRASPRQLIREGTERLGGDPASRRFSELLLSELLSVGRTALYLEEKDLSEEAAHRFFRLLEGVQEGKPFQYLLGKAAFMGEPFQVTPDCFIPRVETELLVEACLDYFNERQPLLLMDIGTGSGCIAISLTKRLTYSNMLAIDLMEEALRIARQNGQFHRVTERISWICGDLFSPLRKGMEADAILSNPPYIPSEEITSLPPEVQKEPRLSLDGGASGLDYYRRMAKESSSFLKEGGLLFFEIGDDQKNPILEIFSESPFHLVEVREDLCGKPRIMIFRKKAALRG